MADGPEKFVWLNEALLPAGRARIDPNDRGLTLGDGLFETIRVAGGTPRHFGLHLKRLRQGAAQLGIPLALDNTRILAAIASTLSANALTDEAVVRLTLTRGAGARGVPPPANVNPTLLITAAVLSAPSPSVNAVICRSTRRNEFSPLCAIKSLNYLDCILARREALGRGAEDAIILNTQGDVAEATASNVFLLDHGKWLTPCLRDGALPGVFRGLTLAHKTAREARITEADLFTAQSICLGNVLGLRAVAKLDERPVEIQPEAVAGLRAILDRED